MNEDGNQDRFPKPRTKKKHPPALQPDLNPNHLAGHKIAQRSDAQVEAEWTAFHLRKRGMDLGAVNDEQPTGEPEPGQE